MVNFVTTCYPGQGYKVLIITSRDAKFDSGYEVFLLKCSFHQTRRWALRPNNSTLVSSVCRTLLQTSCSDEFKCSDIQLCKPQLCFHVLLRPMRLSPGNPLKQTLLGQFSFNCAVLVRTIVSQMYLLVFLVFLSHCTV